MGDLGISTGPGLEKLVQNSDRILCIGARLGELPTKKYSLVQAPVPHAKLFHVHADIGELGRVYRPDVAVNSSSASFVSRLQNVNISRHSSWLKRTQQGRNDFVSHSTLKEKNSSLLNEMAISWLREYLPPDAIVASGSGISSGVLHRFYYYGARYRTQVAPATGSMGYSVPAAIAAKICEPDRKVVCVSGDGCFLMTGQEMATAAMLNLDITFIVINNGTLGTIRKHQERDFPGRMMATDLLNPDFAQYAESFGAMGLIATTIEEFVEAFKKADSHTGLALIDLQIDREKYIKSLIA